MKNLGIRLTVGSFVLFLLTFVAAVPHAGAWWNENWDNRKKITFDTTAAGADIQGNVNEVPILVKLHTGNFSFTGAKDDGSDIRFVAGDDLTLLRHHIEWYDSIDEIALIWVRVSRLSGSSKQDSIWMYYGNEDAGTGSDASGTYDSSHIAVFHFSEMEGVPADMSSYSNNASTFVGGQGLPSIIGKGIALGGGDRMVITSTPSLNISGGFTFSAWIRISTAQEDAYLFSRQETDASVIIGIESTRLYCRVTAPDGETLMAGSTSEISLGNWHHVAVTAEHKGRLAMFIDGVETYGVDLSPALPELARDIAIGASIGGEHGLFGDLDELVLSNRAQSSAWIKTLYASQSPTTQLYSLGEEEVFEGGGGMLLGYMSIVGKNITPSGWVIIGLLMIILSLSVIIFVDKAYTLRGAIKDSDAFTCAIQEQEDFLSLEDVENEFEGSPMYRIYRQGKKVMKNHIRTYHHDTYVHPKALSFLKAELERLSVREVQALNSKLVMLTVAITGGPFLGLLGTVWGVMNTFAAMAQAGEANIMAIAPGVASALSTTVFGLIVAIPALFGYNYLTTKIKNITADIYVFIDEFAVNIEENYGEYRNTEQNQDKRREAL